MDIASQLRGAAPHTKVEDLLLQAADEIERMQAALALIRRMDRRSSGQNSEDHTEYDGPCGKVAAQVIQLRPRP